MKELILSIVFDQYLGDSLLNLTNLERLTFGYNFKQKLEPLLELKNLKQIILDTNYKETIPDQLKPIIIRK